MTAVRHRLLPLLAAAACAIAFAGPALAQDSAAKPDAAALLKDLPKPAPADWLKMCGKDQKTNVQTCNTDNYLLAAAGNVVGQIRVVDISNGKQSKRMFVAQIPPQFLIQPGVNLVIDNEKKPIAGKFTLCLANGCYAEVPLSDENLAKLKKGDELTLFAANPGGQWVGAKATLAGFTKAYEGQATDFKDYQAKRKAFLDAQHELETALLKRVDEQRKKLEAEQSAKGGSTAGAPAKK